MIKGKTNLRPSPAFDKKKKKLSSSHVWQRIHEGIIIFIVSWNSDQKLGVNTYKGMTENMKFNIEYFFILFV